MVFKLYLLKLSNLKELNVTNHQLTSSEIGTPIDTLDGGYAWFIVLVGFLVNFMVFGIAYSYGVLLSYYQLEKFGESILLTFVGTLSVAMIGIGSIFTSRINRLIKHRMSVFIGGLIFSIAILLSSWASKPWHLLLTQGLMMGLGGSLSYMAAVAAVLEWFNMRRGIACGISMSGSGIGGLIIAPSLQYLILNLGMEWTLRLFSLLTLTIHLLCALLIRNPHQPYFSTTTSLSKSFIKDSQFQLLILAVITFGIGFLTPLLYIQNYTLHLGFSKHIGALLIGLINGSAAIGRVSTGLIGDYIGSINALCLSMTLTGVSTIILWTYAQNLFMVTLFCLLYGFLSSGFAALPVVVSVQLFGIGDLPVLTSFIYLSTGISNLIGTPLIKEILTFPPLASQSPYPILIIYSGSTAILAGVLILLLKLRKGGLFKKI